MRAAYAVLLPDRLDIGPSDLRPVPDGASLEDLLPADTPHRARYVCALAGVGIPPHTYIPRAQWGAIPDEGQVIVFHRPVLGGGDGGSDPARVIIALASAYITQNYGAVYGALFSVGATALLNIANRPDAQQLAPASPTYSFQGPGNTARIDQTIPELFGHGNPYPDLASQPYYTYDENGDQFYHAIFLVSEGEVDILRLSIDDTPIVPRNTATEALQRMYFLVADIPRVGQGWAA